MSYRFVKVTTFYPEYLKNYYRRYPDIVSKTYAEQMQHMMGDAPGVADFLEFQLRLIGVDAHIVIANASILQQAWAREHGIKASGKELVMAQLKNLQPDVIFFQDSFNFQGNWIVYLREQVPSIKQVIGWMCAPFTDDDVQEFRAFDYMLTCGPGSWQALTEQGLRMHLFHHAFEGSLLPKIYQNNDYPVKDCIFTGNLFTGPQLHNSRTRMLEELLESNIDLSIYSNLEKVNFFKLFVKQGAYIVTKPLRSLGFSGVIKQLPGLRKAASWNQFPQAHRYSKPLRNAVMPPLYGIEMLRVLSHAKIGLNFHIDVAGTYAANMRLYEVTGVGSCLLTDWKENLHEFFELDREVVTYKSVEECLEKAKWLLEHPKEREMISKAGQARTLKDHTYEMRALQLDDLIKTEFKTQ